MEKCGVFECPMGREHIVENNIISYFLIFNRQKGISSKEQTMLKGFFKHYFSYRKLHSNETSFLYAFGDFVSNSVTEFMGIEDSPRSLHKVSNIFSEPPIFFFLSICRVLHETTFQILQ